MARSEVNKEIAALGLPTPQVRAFDGPTLGVQYYVDPYNGDLYDMNGLRTGWRFDDFPDRINGASALDAAQQGLGHLVRSGLSGRLAVSTVAELGPGGKKLSTWVFVVTKDNEDKGMIPVGHFVRDIVKNGPAAALEALAAMAWQLVGANQ